MELKDVNLVDSFSLTEVAVFIALPIFFVLGTTAIQNWFHHRRRERKDMENTQTGPTTHPPGN
jgi:hypothetical protein